MHALHAYIAGMDKMHPKQYTIRGISERMDLVLRERSAKYGKSMNEVALDALAKGLGLGDEPVLHHDLDHLAGTWVHDPEFDAIMKDMDKIDPDLWK
jgi:hypothetical protein